KMLGKETRMAIAQREYTDPDTLELLGIEFTQSTGLPGMDQDTRIRRDGKRLVIETLAGGQVTGSRAIPYDRAAMQSTLAASQRVRDALDPATGGAFTSSIFDPTALRPVHTELVYSPLTEIYYNGVAEQAYEVKSTVKELGVGGVSYETADGRVLKSTLMAGMFELRLEEEAIAKSAGAVPDLMAASRVAITGQPIPEQPVALLEVVPVIDQDPTALFLPTERQRFETRQRRRVLVVDMLGPGQGPEVRLSAADRKALLGGDLYVQPGDPAIQRQARAIVKGLPTGNERQRAFAITYWVYATLEKAIVPTTPNAVQVLQTKRGDCGEHAVLTAALARAVGIPAKVNYGLVYTPQYGEGFFYHAWNSLLVEGTWLEVDSALGMFPADATHIKIGEGDDPGSALGIMQLYGKLGLEVQRAVPGEFESGYHMVQRP
ncbi:MAG TPA: transglutaminase-like domain-containing protein, partial [bacterium]|nr:transglutaminase-like domain-containing protein [bacterium]